MDYEKYYQKIKQLNVRHYAGEVPYYSKAGLRPVEEKVLGKLHQESRILDLGCGSGRFSIGAAKLGFRTTGVDITPEAVKAAKVRAVADGVADKADFMVGDMTALPFGDASFDYVFCPRFSINAVATFGMRKKAVSEMIRVVKPGGLVFVESFNRFYCGRGPLMPFINCLRDAWRYMRLGLARLTPLRYGGLLPGDITYPANKVKGAPEGYAHLPIATELRKWAPNGTNVALFSIPEITGRKRRDALRYFRYSLWMVVGRKESIAEAIIKKEG